MRSFSSIRGPAPVGPLRVISTRRRPSGASSCPKSPQSLLSSSVSVGIRVSLPSSPVSRLIFHHRRRRPKCHHPHHPVKNQLNAHVCTSANPSWIRCHPVKSTARRDKVSHHPITRQCFRRFLRLPERLSAHVLWARRLPGVVQHR